MLAPWKKSCDQPRQHIKKQRHYFVNKVSSSPSYGFPIIMYGCESWTIKKAECWRIDAFELWCWRRLFESPLDCKEIQPVHPKGDQSWLFIGRTDAEGPILWPTDVKSWLIRKDPDAGKAWRQQEEKGTTEDEMVRWHHRLHGQEVEQAPGDGEGQGSLACCGPWGQTRLSNWTTKERTRAACESALSPEQSAQSGREGQSHHGSWLLGLCTLENATPSGQQAPSTASGPQAGVFIPSVSNAPDIWGVSATQKRKINKRP